MNPGILKVSDEASKDIIAQRAALHLTIDGENFIFGNAALEKCQELKLAVGKLKAINPEGDLAVDSVVINNASGWFAKGSKGAYHVVFQLSSLAKLNDALAVIIDLKNVKLDSLEWLYDDEREKLLLLAEAVQRCQAKAAVMAKGLGRSIIGVQHCADAYHIPRNDQQRFEGGGGGSAPGMGKTRARASMAVDIGAPIRGKKEITAIACIEFYLDNSPNS